MPPSIPTTASTWKTCAARSPTRLDEKSEQLINLKDADGMSALMTLYTMLTSRLEFTLTVDGETQTLTRDALMANVYSPDPERRAAAYQELYRVYAKEAPILAQIYANRVRDWYNEQVTVRGYHSPIAVRNVANDVPDAAVDALLDVCRRNAGVFQRYFKLKARWLGLEKLRRYDIYAPLAASDTKVEYDKAVDMVLDTFRRFHPQVAEQALRVFDQDHIDSEVRKGKRGGAFCATVLPVADALGAGQLHRQGARRRHDCARTGPCHPQHGRRESLAADPAPVAPLGGDGFGLCRDAADRTPAGRAARPAGAP